MIHLHRVYGHETAPAGQQFLVERLWPRGVRKDALHLSGWTKDAAPSSILRRWFAHDVTKWPDFKRDTSLSWRAVRTPGNPCCSRHLAARSSSCTVREIRLITTLSRSRAS